jgi:hypothetical protein
MVFWQGPGGHLWEAWGAGTSWNGPVDLSSTWSAGGLLASAPSVALTPDGQQHVYWTGSDSHIWGAWYAGGWNGPVDWYDLGATRATPDAEVVNGQPQLFWQGSDGDLVQTTWAGSWKGPVDWSGAAFGGAPLASAPSAAVTTDGSTQLVFWQSPAGHLTEAWYTGSWNGPVDWTAAAFGGRGTMTSAPSATVTPDGGTQLVFWQGAGGHLVEAWWAGGRWNGPVDWTAAAFGGADQLNSAPAVAVSPDGATQTVFWQGTNGHLIEAWWAGGRWNGPVDWSAMALGGAALGSAPSAAMTRDGGQQIVFWAGPGGHLLEAWWGGGRWNGPVDWTSAALGGAAPLSSAPSVAVTPQGDQLVTWRGGDGHLWETSYGDTWSAAVDQSRSWGGAAPLTSSPGLTVTPGGQQELFWQGAASHLFEAWWPTAWQAPIDWTAIGVLG